jgi:hypothetical protein
MVEKTIKSVSVMPFALMLACISAVIGLIVGIFYSLTFGFIFATIPSSAASGLNIGLLSLIFGVGAIITMPIAFFVGGLIQGLITAALYNFLAPRIGGIKVRFKEDSPSPPPA